MAHPGDETGTRSVRSDISALGTIGELVGLQVDDVSGEHMQIRWTITPDLHQPHGILHGGVHCWIVESVASMGASAWYSDRGLVVGVSNQTDFFRGASEGEMTSIGTPVHRGRLQQLWDVETRDSQGRLIARGQVRLQNLPHRAA